MYLFLCSGGDDVEDLPVFAKTEDHKESDTCCHAHASLSAILCVNTNGTIRAAVAADVSIYQRSTGRWIVSWYDESVVAATIDGNDLSVMK